MRLSQGEQILKERQLYELLAGYFSAEEQESARDSRQVLTRAALASEADTTFSMFVRMGHDGYLPLNRLPYTNRRSPFVLAAHLVEVTELKDEPPRIALRSDYNLRFVGRRIVTLSVSDAESTGSPNMRFRNETWRHSEAAFRTGPPLDHLLDVVTSIRAED